MGGKAYLFIYFMLWVGSLISSFFVASLDNCSFRIPIFFAMGISYDPSEGQLQRPCGLLGGVAAVLLKGLLVQVSLSENIFFMGKWLWIFPSEVHFLWQRGIDSKCFLQRNGCYSHSRMANHACESLEVHSTVFSLFLL